MSNIYEIDGMVPVVADGAFVHPGAVIIGDVIVGENVYIAPGAVLRGDMGRIVVDAGANIQDGCVLHGWPDCDTVIEEEGHLGHLAIVHGARVRRGALIGMGATVLEKAVVGEYAMVAAAALVLAGTEVPAKTLVAGVPAKPKRVLTEAEIERKTRGTLAYQELARRSTASLKPVRPLKSPEPGRKRVQDIVPGASEIKYE